MIFLGVAVVIWGCCNRVPAILLQINFACCLMPIDTPGWMLLVTFFVASILLTASMRLPVVVPSILSSVVLAVIQNWKVTFPFLPIWVKPLKWSSAI